MISLRTFVVMLVAASAVLGQDEECEPEDLPVIELSGIEIYPTNMINELFEVGEENVTVEIVRRQIDSETEQNKVILELAEAVVNDSENELRTTMEVAPVLSDSATPAERIAYSEYFHYHASCPYRYYWLRRYHWFHRRYTFIPFLQQYVYEYCWAFWPLWGTSCGYGYCKLNFSPRWYWYHYYRCFPEYRYVWVYVRCWNPYQGWYSKGIRIRIPYGCCCKRYWRIPTLQTCPAEPLRDSLSTLP